MAVTAPVRLYASEPYLAILQLAPPKPIPVPTIAPAPAPRPTTVIAGAPAPVQAVPLSTSAGCGASCTHAPAPVLRASDILTSASPAGAYVSPPANEAPKLSLSIASVQAPAAEVKTLPAPGVTPRGPAELLAWISDNGNLVFWLIVLLALWGLSRSSGGHTWR